MSGRDCGSVLFCLCMHHHINHLNYNKVKQSNQVNNFFKRATAITISTKATTATFVCSLWFLKRSSS